MRFSCLSKWLSQFGIARLNNPLTVQTLMLSNVDWKAKYIQVKVYFLSKELVHLQVILLRSTLK